MNKDILLQLFKAPYIRQNFIDNVIVPLFKGKVANITIYENSAVVPIRLTDSEAEFVKSAVKYGEIITADELPRTIELYEVIVDNTKQIERSRVGLNALVKKHIIGDNAVMVNFAYDKPENRSWRFSFIARDGIFQDGEMKVVDTNPKRYTYVFGQPDETFKTAIDRFTTLANEFEITINKIKDAFSVEAMSKAFFDDYRDVHYAGFVDYLMRSNFLKSAFNGNDKDVRDFVKKLLGRIVFLYFLQKKGWMGASNTEYKDGDKNFISNYFRQSGADDAFYPNWLAKLFFEALNSPRTNDDFVLPNGKTVKIPYLNGGLFEKQSKKYDFLTFPAEMFENLFNFFDQYNFTIFEDSPEEHTVAVDPEMLGHIFENLLEDNKDKGAFYTPKEIVHYMTQESLIEYLHTQLPDADKNKLEAFIKNKPSNLSKDIKAAIGQKLDTVKICDPAIGSGAFPMGLLQEIYSIKERIAFDLNLPWDNTQAAATKANIIQNSIYGVDIERGAVDIARLRFWLSLIVDEEKPKSLPNLDYKIVVGNSLVSKFEDTVIEIDWSVDTAKEGLFGQELAEEKITLLKKISEKQNQYFLAENNEKPKLKAEINQLKIDILIKQLQLMIETKGFNQESMQGLNKKQLEVWQQTQDWKAALLKLKQLKENPNKPFNHFDWKLNFPEVLNPLVNENCGFDIVIGNPPYIKEYTNKDAFNGFRNSPYYMGKMDLWYGFACIGIDLLKENGVESFIAQNNWITSAGASIFRNKVLKETEIKLFTDFWNYKVFKTAGIQTMIYLLKKKKPNNNNIVKYSVLKESNLKDSELINFLDFEVNSNNSEKFLLEFNNEDFIDGTIVFNNPKIQNVLAKILNNNFTNLSDSEVAQGIVFPQDKLNRKNATLLGGNLEVNAGIFLLTKQEIESLNLDENEWQLIKPFYSTKELLKYYGNSKNNEYLIYTKSNINNDIEQFPNIKSHLDKFQSIITSDNKPYGLHRARKEEFFLGEKIISVRKYNEPTFTYTDFDCYVTQTFYSIKTKRLNLKYLTILLNSKLIKFWLRYKGKMQGDNYQIDKEPLLEIPIVPNNENLYQYFLDMIVFLYSNQSRVSDMVKNEIIAKYFEEIMDGCVFDLYFTEYMKSIKLYIKDAVQLECDVHLDGIDFNNLHDDSKCKIIWNIYEKLSHPDHIVKNTILKYPIYSPEILKAILEN